MEMKFGLLVPQGWHMDLAGISDPVVAYETMTRVAQEIILYMPGARDLASVRLFARECMS